MAFIDDLADCIVGDIAPHCGVLADANHRGHLQTFGEQGIYDIRNVSWIQGTRISRSKVCVGSGPSGLNYTGVRKEGQRS